MEQKDIIQKTADFAKESLTGMEGGHDWWHTYRVWQTAKHIARTEKVELFVVELGALLHDIADSKFYGGDEEIGPKKAREFLGSLNVEEKIIEHIAKIVANVSFKGGAHVQEFKSPELDVVQDADRLDAIGAIGIARVFNYGGHKNREIYNPQIKPKPSMTKEEYKSSHSPSLNHFSEKLLLLKDRMNTQTGKQLAEGRHRFMEQYLEQFHREWEGKI